MNKTLTKELTRTIFGSIGFVPKPNFGKLGISIDKYLTSEEIRVTMDSEEEDIYSIWAGKVIQDQSELVILSTAIICKEYTEFNAVYKIDNSYIHGLKSSYYDEDEIPNLFLYKKDNKWNNLNIYNQLLSTAGFIKIADLGTEFKAVKEIDGELLQSLHQLIEI
jgi:hypothetical protein